MQKATARARRIVERLRPGTLDSSTRVVDTSRQTPGTARHLRRRFLRLAGSSRNGAHRIDRSPALSLRRLVDGQIASDRVLPVGAAIIVLAAALLSVGPATAAHAAPPTGGTTGSGQATRLTVGGVGAGIAESGQYGGPFTPFTLGSHPIDVAADGSVIAATGDTAASTGDSASTGPFLQDGTLLKPVSVNTQVADGSNLLRTYTVQSGDTLTGIAGKFQVSMMTIWWANDLSSKDALHIGQTLTIPPVSGLVVTVKDGDTLDSLAATYHINASDILTVNGLNDPNLIIGQTLILPGASGDAIPTPAPTPTPKPAPKPVAVSSGGGTSRYTGGALLWPVVGGNNYISQYYHYGHWAIDIAATYGSTVRAAAAGTVIFAGWKSNGGGYQVWISHGGNLYTTYNHMSAVLVGAGQRVGRGQQVGRIGMSGDATGPHLHFEVWIGPVWNGGTRVNPLNYL